MAKAKQLATQKKSNPGRVAKNQSPKKGLTSPKKAAPARAQKNGVGAKKFEKKGKVVAEDSDENESEELNDGESNEVENGADPALDEDSSSDDDEGVSTNAFGNTFKKTKNEVEEDDDDDDDDDDDEEPLGDEEAEGDEQDDEEQDDEEEEDNEDDDEEPDEETVKTEEPVKNKKAKKATADLWSSKAEKGESKDRDGDSCTIFVKRLKNRTSEEDIREHFKSCGEIKSVRFQKISRLPEAVVTFVDEASSKAARKMHNSILNDSNILITYPNKPTSNNTDPKRSAILMNVEKFDIIEVTKLEKIFSKCGEIESMDVVCDPNVLAFLVFTTEEAVENALKLNGTVQDGLQIHIKPYRNSRPKTKVFITNISKKTTEDDLRKMFESCGAINHIGLKHTMNKDATCVITFDNEDGYCKSFLLHGEVLFGKRLLLQPYNFKKGESIVPNPNPKPSTGGNRPNAGLFQGNRPNGGLFQGKRPYAGPFQGNRPNGGQFQGNRPNGGQFQGNRPNAGPFQGNRPNAGPFQGNRPNAGPFQGKRPNAGPFQGKRPNAGSYQGNKEFSTGPFQFKRAQPSNDQKQNSNADLWNSGPPAKKTKVGFKNRTEQANE